MLGKIGESGLQDDGFLHFIIKKLKLIDKRLNLKWQSAMIRSQGKTDESKCADN